MKNDAVLFAVPPHLLLNLQTILEDKRMADVMETVSAHQNATVHGRAWYKVSDSPVLIWDVPPGVTFYSRTCS